MTTVEALRGTGRFQWNAGGWFGALLGSTLFLPIGALSFGGEPGGLAAIWWLCWAVSLGSGVWLWSRRDRVAPYTGIQVLLGILGVANVIALLSLVRSAPDALDRVNLSPLGVLACILIVPALMLQFALLEARARRAAVRDQA